jgi:hypothetical protein
MDWQPIAHGRKRQSVGAANFLFAVPLLLEQLEKQFDDARIAFQPGKIGEDRFSRLEIVTTTVRPVGD